MLDFASEPDLQAAIERGDFVESHYCEAKAILPGSSPSKNKELARDLAQFAVDGGVLVFGVAENKDNHTFSLTPLEVPAGALERIEQVAATACQPPLPVVPRLINSDVFPGTGYLVVEVPVSPRAPHMVDGRYPARGETQKRYLDDTELRALLAGRAAEMERVDQVLDQLIRADPLGEVEPMLRNAHFFAAAIPLTAAAGEDADRELLQGTYQAARDAVRTEHMLRTYPQAVRTRSTGCVMVSEWLLGNSAYLAELSGTDRWQSIIDRTAEFGVRHDGGIWAYHSRLSKRDDRRVSRLFPRELVNGTLMVIAAAAKWAHVRGYHGSWALGVATTGMAGARPVDRELWDTDPVLTDDRYRRTAQATTAELGTDPEAVAQRLTGRFLAMCGR